MTPDEFAEIARDAPESEPGGHQGADDFRVRKKIFATLDRQTGVGALKLTPEEQGLLMAASAAFYPANGTWGARGWTKVRLAEAADNDVRAGVNMAWANVAPKSLLKLYEDQSD